MTTLLMMDIKQKLESDLKSRSSDAVFGMKFTIYLGGIIIGLILTLSQSWLLRALGIFTLGAMFAHGVELQHQVLHNQGFKNKKLNEGVGIILGLPLLVSFAGYQASHLRHHRLLGTPENKEFFDYGDQYGTSTFGSIVLWIRRFLMPAHYISFLKNTFRSIFNLSIPEERPEVSKRIRRDHLWMLTTIFFLLLISALFNPFIILLVWLAPLVLVAAPLHALIEMPEHYQCDVSSTDAFHNTRTIKSNAFMTWYTNGNNYHVEHHLR